MVCWGSKLRLGTWVVGAATHCAGTRCSIEACACSTQLCMGNQDRFCIVQVPKPAAPKPATPIGTTGRGATPTVPSAVPPPASSAATAAADAAASPATKKPSAPEAPLSPAERYRQKLLQEQKDAA